MEVLEDRPIAHKDSAEERSGAETLLLVEDSTEDCQVLAPVEWWSWALRRRGCVLRCEERCDRTNDQWVGIDRAKFSLEDG